MVRISLLAVLLLSGSALTGCQPSPTRPGHTGPVPSAAGQALIGSIEGQTLRPSPTSTPWVVLGFGVVPNPVTGKGPVVLLERGSERGYLPVLGDADAADLYQRVSGKKSELAGQTSPTYQAGLERLETPRTP